MDPNHIFYACVSTYDSLRERGHSLLDIVELWLRDMVNPLGLALEYNCFGEGSSVSLRKFGPKAWERIRSHFLNGAIEEFSIFHYSDALSEEAKRMQFAGEKGGPSAMVLQVSMSYRPHDPSLAGILEFGVQRRPYADLQIPQVVQSTVINSLLDLCSRVNEQTGFITTGRYRSQGPCSADEMALGIPYSVAARQLRQYVRGANWGNFLGPVHVQALGGTSRVLKEAPCHLAKELPNGGAYLQLTEDVNLYGEDELAKLRQFLQPVMPPKWEREPTRAIPVPAPEPEPEWGLDPRTFEDWPDIGFSLRFTRSLTDAEQGAIKDIVLAWYTVGVNGGYPEGFLHNITDLDFEEPDLLMVGIDCGSCSPSVLEVLERMLRSACSIHGFGVKQVGEVNS